MGGDWDRLNTTLTLLFEEALSIYNPRVSSHLLTYILAFLHNHIPLKSHSLTLLLPFLASRQIVWVTLTPLSFRFRLLLPHRS